MQDSPSSHGATHGLSPGGVVASSVGAHHRTGLHLAVFLLARVAQAVTDLD